jgi:hypothetical protein
VARSQNWEKKKEKEKEKEPSLVVAVGVVWCLK